MALQQKMQTTEHYIKPQSIISNGVECGQGFGGFWFQGIYVCVLIFKES